MELSKEWLGKAAGWRAFQEGRKLHLAGRVLEASRDENFFSGVLQASPRPRKVRVKINSPNDIDTHCTCAENRRDGAFCGHAVALILQTLKGDAAAPSPSGTSLPQASLPKAPKPSASPSKITKAYDIRIRSCALEALARSRPLSFSIDIAASSPSDTDELIGEWMQSLHLESDENHQLLQVSGPQLESFLQALAGHDRIWVGDDLINFPSNRYKPSLELKSTNTLFCREVSGKWMQIGKQWWWISAERWQAGPDCGPWTNELLEKGRIKIDEHELIDSLDWLSDAFELTGKAFESLEFVPQQAVIELRLEGSGAYLEAHPIAHYADRKVDILDGAQARPWHAEGAEWGTFHTRDRTQEYELIDFLEKRGFRKDQGEPTMRLRGEELVIDFLARDMESMRNIGWNIEPSPTLSKILSKIEIIQPRIIEKQGSSSSEGWLDIEISYPGSSGRNFSQKDIQQVLRSGRRKFKLPNGKLGIIDQTACADLEAMLEISAPKQTQANHYRIGTQHLESLKQSVGLLSENKRIKEDKLVKSVKVAERQIQADLRPYQREGVAWLVEHCGTQRGALLADDMGLGKTLQSIALIIAAREAGLLEPNKPCLVVAPTSLLNNWQDEFEKFTPKLKTLLWHGSKRDDKRAEIDACDVIITSYGILARDRVLFREREWGIAFIDEASLIRNPDADIAKSCHALKADYRVAITGTPVENSVKDLWSCFQFIIPDYLGSRKSFEERFLKPCSERPPEPTAMRRLRMRVEPHLIRRKKEEVASELPTKQESIIWCGLSQTQSELYQKLLTEGQNAVAEIKKKAGAGAAKMQVLTTLLRLRQCCCDVKLTGVQMPDKLSLAERSLKLSRLLELVSELRNNSQKALVFSQFTSQLDSVFELLEAMEVNSCRLDGSTRNRGEVVSDFQRTDGPEIFLISLKAGGYGLNLTEADVVIHLDPWWNPAAERQATDRAHRIGQTKPVTVYKFATKGTVEEKIIRLQQSKTEISDSLIQSSDNRADGPGALGVELESLLES